MVDSVHFSSDRDDWETPPDLFARLHTEFGFTLDCCASPDNAKCERYFTPEDDGLEQPWTASTVWMNPPYGRVIGKWIARAWVAASQEGATVACLIPARTDTRWWHDYCMRAHEIRFIRGRVRFVGAKAGAPFPSALVIFRPPPRPERPVLKRSSNRGDIE